MTPDWPQLIGNLGFPICVAGYVLWRLNGKMDKNTEAVQENTAQLGEMVHVMNNLINHLGLSRRMTDWKRRTDD